MNPLKLIQKAVLWIDAAQQRYPFSAIPYAVIKKYGEDRGNERVALLTYYGFLALFPLLLLLLTSLEVALSSHPHLRDTILHNTLNTFPALSHDLGENISTLSGTWYRIVLSGILTLLASLGIANTLRETIHEIWQIPYTKRRGFPWNYLSNIGIILLSGLVLAATTLVVSLVTKNGTLWYFGLSVIINFGLFLAVFRIATPNQIKTKHLITQSAVTAIMWQILQLTGSYLVERELSNLNLLYGSFAVVLGLLFWLYFVARVAVYAIEIDAVIANHLWPRSVAGETTEAGRRAYTRYAEAQKRLAEEDIAVTFTKKRKK
jgi:YihY family inner membrane protein